MSCVIPRPEQFLCCFSLRKVTRIKNYCQCVVLFLSIIIQFSSDRPTQGILLSVVLHSLVCTLLLLLYIPYSLHWSPVIHQLQSPGSQTPAGLVGIIYLIILGEISSSDFDWRIFDKTLVIILLFLLITDLFLIVGVRKEHK